jgi:hypothetical protein
MPTKARKFGLAFVAAVQPPTAGWPGHGSLDHPAVAAQPLRGLDTLAGDAGADSTFAEPTAQLVVVIPHVGVRLRRPSTPGPAARADPNLPRSVGFGPDSGPLLRPARSRNRSHTTTSPARLALRGRQGSRGGAWPRPGLGSTGRTELGCLRPRRSSRAAGRRWRLAGPAGWRRWRWGRPGLWHAECGSWRPRRRAQ